MQNIYYVNSAGEKVSLCEKPYVYKGESIFEYGYDSDITKGVQKLSLTIQVWSNDFANAINKLSEFFERDVIAKMQGRLYCNDNYVYCFITKVKANDFYRKNCTATLEVTISYPYWINEYTKRYYTSGNQGGVGLRFPFKFPFKFTKPVKDKVLANSHYAASKAKIIIYGGAVNPKITIAGNVYQVYDTLGDSEYIVIDQMNKTIIKYINTQTASLFNSRNKDYDIFKSIPAGANAIDYDGTFAFDIILYRERSLPLWK